MEDWPYKYFTKEEMACRCGCGTLPSHILVGMLEFLREELGIPLVVTSGARCADHNERVSTTGRDGPHVRGLAADLAVYGENAFHVVRVATRIGFTGIGIKQKGPVDGRFIHLDVVDEEDTEIARPTIFSY